MTLKKLGLAITFATAVSAAPFALALSELATAIQDGDAAAVRTLIRNKTDVNAAERDGTTPLQWAVYSENLPIVEQLIKAKADVNSPNREGMTPLALAAEAGNVDIVRKLLDAGAEVNKTLNNGETPLMMAARTGNVGVINLMIERGATINAVENLRGTTALMWAASNRNAPAVKALLAKGADYKITAKATNEGRNNPYLAPTARERIRDFYDKTGLGAVQEKPQELRDANEKSAEVTHEELMKRLPPQLVKEFMEEDARLKAEGNAPKKPQKMKRGGLTALHFAVRENDIDSAAALIEAGADVNQVSE